MGGGRGSAASPGGEGVYNYDHPGPESTAVLHHV